MIAANESIVVGKASPHCLPPPRGRSLDETQGRAPSEFQHLCAKAVAVRQALPKFIYFYLCAIYLTMALLVWWVPACDFDTMTSYLARIHLERIGPLRETATLEIQYLFPKFFDYLHAPFLDWGWFTTLPNFALFTAVLVAAVWKLPTEMAGRFILGLAISAPILTAAMSAKNDITLALLGVLCWFWIYHARPSSPWYLAVVMLLAAALIGTKWHGLVLAPVFAAMAGIEVVRRRALTRFSIIVLMACFPLAWYASSASVYLENLQYEGALCPTPDYLVVHPSVAKNLWAFASNTVLETFELPFYWVDAQLGGRIWPVLNKVVCNSKAWNYVALPNSHVHVFGLPLLIVFGAALVAVFKRGTPWSIRCAGAVAAGYGAIVLVLFPYSTWINRYFLPTYVFGLLAFVYLVQSVRLRGALRWGFFAYLIFVSLYTMIFNQHMRLVHARLYAAEANTVMETSSIFADGWDRDALYFHLWSGHLAPYRIFREQVRSHHRLLIVNHLKGNNVPFIYPFVRGRTGANTRIINLRRGQSIPEDATNEFDFVLTYGGEFTQSGFAALFASREIALYENTVKKH
jgi:hypothetical protein